MPEPQEPFIGEDGKSEQERIALAFKAVEHEAHTELWAQGVYIRFKSDGSIEGRHAMTAGGAAQVILDLGRAHNPMPGWRPISTAPKDGTVFLGWSEREWFAQPICWERPNCDDGSHPGEPNEWVYADFDLHARTGVVSPTHWMPIPAPPEAT